MDEILTASEAAVLLKVHKRTIYRLAEEGIIPGSHIGHRWRFSKENILALVCKSGNADRIDAIPLEAKGPGVPE